MANIFKFFTLLVIFSSAHLARAAAPQKLSAKSFQVCGQKLSLEVAAEPESRRIGLMHRQDVKSGTGMLFVFSEPQPLSFWMRNVPFDIDIGYFDRQGKLLNSLTMAGTSELVRDESLPSYPSQGLAVYAVEARKGFFAGLGDVAKPGRCRLNPLPHLAKR